MSQRQLFFIICLIIPTYKVGLLPSVMAGIGGRDMYFTVLLPMLLDVLVLGGIFFIKTRVGTLAFSNKGFHVLTCVFGVAFGLYFLLQAVVLGEETLSYLLQSFFDDGDRLQLVIPLIVASCYLAYKGAKSVGRVSEILIWFLGFTVVVSILFNTAEYDLGDIRPVLDGGVGRKLLGGFQNYFWFGDYLPLLFIDIRDTKKRKPLLLLAGAVVVAVAVSLINGIFYAQWGNLTESVPYAFARLSGYNVISSDVGKVDWITILNWILSGSVKLCFLFLGFAGVVRYVFGEKKERIGIPVGGVIVFLLSVFWVKNVKIAYEIGESIALISLVIGVVLPIILVIFACFSPKKGVEWGCAQKKNNCWSKLDYENTQE